MRLFNPVFRKNATLASIVKELERGIKIETRAWDDACDWKRACPLSQLTAASNHADAVYGRLLTLREIAEALRRVTS